MGKILRVHNVNDYARYIGAPVLHPLVSVIHYDELEHCRHSLNNYDVFALFIGDEKLEDLSYGQLQYDLSCHALMCVAPVRLAARPTWARRVTPEAGLCSSTQSCCKARNSGDACPIITSSPTAPARHC